MKTTAYHPDHPVFPFDLHWDAQQLTDAVPLRLFELINFQALHFGQCDCSANNACASRKYRPIRSYAPHAPLPRFRVY